MERKDFKLHSAFAPTGDQPQAIEKLTEGLRDGLRTQVLLGVTGSGKTFTMANVIKTSVFLADLNDFAAMNKVYETFFTAPYPTRSCVQVAAIPKGAKIEIECIAVK